ncbi:TPR-repeat protein [Danaus plexippus plexippus]|uniref:RNA polymerase II-associated protein 3 n=2 Tax=Danaus plexippus TaxID=13037 RepID=A0A212FDM1_DANPL|nr:TPR-repeat protein [Danaus plexippus plexippus]
MDKAFEIQKKARDNVKTLHTYLTDLQNWEIEMKRKEAALNGDLEQELPPVRSKVKRERPVQVKQKPEKKIVASDYQAWEKFDAEKACEEVDMADIGPVSLDSKKSNKIKTEKLKEEAQYEKERGNSFVKQEKWDEAIACYNRAIELVQDDAIYYANRGLCYLKKDSLHQAESDCTEAIRLDPTYVKAFQRRASAREKLGSLRAASHDLSEVIRLEPHNMLARQQLECIKNRMGTKGSKSKSSPTTPPGETKTAPEKKSKIVELPDSKTELSPLEKWRDGVHENITVIKPVKKPPHLRSKRALKHITIQEIPLGRAIDKSNDTNNNKSTNVTLAADIQEKMVFNVNEKHKESMVVPTNSVQFMSEWKYLKGNDRARGDYLSIIPPDLLPSIFENALESDVLSTVLRTIHNNVDRFPHSVAAYLKNICRVKRFSALAMFLSAIDKELINNMLKHCRDVENLSESEITDLMNKYEL